MFPEAYLLLPDQHQQLVKILVLTKRQEHGHISIVGMYLKMEEREALQTLFHSKYLKMVLLVME
jgi:hypothetical protein